MRSLPRSIDRVFREERAELQERSIVEWRELSVRTRRDMPRSPASSSEEEHAVAPSERSEPEREDDCFLRSSSAFIWFLLSFA